MVLMLFALLALVKSSRLENLQPSECFASYDGLLDCSGRGLVLIEDLPSHLQIERADLSDNGLTHVELNLPPSLIDLDISNNSLRYAKLTSRRLYKLKLSKNPLITLSLDLSGLKILNLTDCLFTFLPEHFFDLLPQLEELDLSGNNRLQAIPPNQLRQLYAQRTAIRGIPKMSNILELDVSNNPRLVNFRAPESLKSLRAANSALVKVILNEGLLYADVSSNQLLDLRIHESLEYLDASNNSLISLDIANARLHTVKLSKNKLTDLRVSSRYLSSIDLSNNPIIELSVHCSQCDVNCSYCQVRKLEMVHVKSLDLQYNYIQNIQISGVKDVDLRHNLLTQISLIADNFDLRHNMFVDPEKVDIQGTGRLANNPWICKCEELRKLRDKSIDEKFLCGDMSFESCFAGPRKTSHSAWLTLIVAVTLLLIFMLLLYFIRLTSKDTNSVPTQEAPEFEQVYRTDALPTYEEALRMSKPEWRQSRHSSRRCRPE